jgi:hypothetical protein
MVTPLPDSEQPAVELLPPQNPVRMEHPKERPPAPQRSSDTRPCTSDQRSSWFASVRFERDWNGGNYDISDPGAEVYH